MKALLLLSLLTSSATFASTSTKTAEAKKATESKALSLNEIAQKAQTISTLLEKDKDASAVLSIDNTGRLNSKDQALKISAENTTTTTATKK